MEAMKNTLIFLSVSVICFFGCAGSMKNAILSEPVKVNAGKLSLVVDSLEIVDGRDAADDRELKIPFFCLSKKRDEVRPILTEEHRNIITKEIGHFTSDSGIPVRVAVSLVYGIKKFEGAAFLEKEFVKTALKVEIFDGKHEPFLLSTTGEANLEVKSLSASNDYLEKLYKKCIRMSLLKALESLNTLETAE